MKLTKTKDGHSPVLIRFENKELETQVINLNQEGATIAVSLGKDQAVQQQPPFVDAKRGAMYYSKITFFFQSIISLIKTTLQTDLIKAEGKHQEIYQQKKGELEADLEQTKHQCKLASRNLQKSEEQSDHLALAKKRRFVWIRLLCLLFVSADLFFSAASLMKIGFSLIVAYIVGAAIAAAIYYAAEVTPTILMKIQNRRKRIAALISILLFFGGVFYSLAYLRTTGTDGTVMVQTPRIMFVLINLFLLSISMVLIWQYKPTKSELEKLDKWLDLKNTLGSAEANKAEKQAELEQHIQDQLDIEEAERALFIYGTDMESIVVDAYHSSFAEYCTQNLYHRSDSNGEKAPPFFSEKLVPLTLYFPKQKTQTS